MTHIIRVVDFETTGLDPADKVVEMGWCDLVNEGDGWKVDNTRSQLYRVEHVPPEARAVHHIAADETADQLPFEPMFLWGRAKLEGVNLIAAHNAGYDGTYWGQPELPVLCTYKSALRIWPDAPSHSNGALRYWLADQGFLSLDVALAMPPHRAGPDAYVTAHVLKAMLATTSASQMVAWTKQPALLPTCPIGEWRGKPWSAVDGGFLKWMIDKPVEPDLVWNAQREIERRRQEAGA